jgi:hypothetical protein
VEASYFALFLPKTSTPRSKNGGVKNQSSIINSTILMTSEQNIVKVLAYLLSVDARRSSKWFDCSEDELKLETNPVASSLRELNTFLLAQSSSSKQSRNELSKGIWNPILDLVAKSPEGWFICVCLLLML